MHAPDTYSECKLIKVSHSFLQATGLIKKKGFDSMSNECLAFNESILQNVATVHPRDARTVVGVGGPVVLTRRGDYVNENGLIVRGVWVLHGLPLALILSEDAVTRQHGLTMIVQN